MPGPDISGGPRGQRGARPLSPEDKHQLDEALASFPQGPLVEWESPEGTRLLSVVDQLAEGRGEAPPVPLSWIAEYLGQGPLYRRLDRYRANRNGADRG